MIDGLSVFPAFSTASEQHELARAIDAAPWSHALRRRTQHYGWRYSYDRRPLNESDHLGELPYWMCGIANRVAPAFDGSAPDQAIVNDYQPGQGISAHIDHVHNFGPVIVSLSLLSTATMYFCRAGQTRSVTLLPGSLLLLEGDARFRWTHAIPQHDARRLSVTFRTVLRAER